MAVLPEQAAASLLKRERERMTRRAEHLEQIRQRVDEAARMLVEDYGAAQVILFGSASGPGELFDDRSDIDRAVAGLAPDVEGQAWTRLSRLFGREVDLNS